MNTTKETVVAFLNRIADYLEAQGMAEDAETMRHRAELQAKKSNGERKPTANQIENAKLAEAVAEGMKAGRQYTATEVMKEFDIPSTSRATAILKIAVDGGAVKKETVKGKSLYSKA